MYKIYLSILFLVPQIGWSLDGVCEKVQGKAFIEKAGQIKALKTGMKIVEQDIVSTGSKSLALIRFKDHSTHKIGENSRLKISDLKNQGVFDLIKGSLISLVVPKKSKKKRKEHFRVRTKAAVVGVRGTQFFVSYGPKKNPDDSWVCVQEGVVEVSHTSGSSKQTVKAGEGVSIFNKTKKVSKPKPLAWTKKINWNMNPDKGGIENDISIEDAYKDLLDVDYD